MARELTTTQQTNVEAGATRPIYLVEWMHSGAVEYLSASGDVTYDSQAYTAGGLTVTSIEDSKTATIVLPATAARVSQVTNSTWRGGTCKITAILAAPGDTPTYVAADGLLMLDGIIESTSFSGENITVTAKCKYYQGALVPRFTYDEVTSIIPAVGALSTWESEIYSYEQWLKTTAAIQRLTRPGANPQVTGRPSTSHVNAFAVGEQTGQKLLTAQGVNIPVVYGRASVPGFIFADGEYSGDKFIGVAWCIGEVFSIEQVYINDALPPSTVAAKHYRGTTTQTVSGALQLYTSTSPQFSDDMILDFPDGGKLGVCYSVFRIPIGAISGAPRFRAIIQGRIVADPSSTASGPFEEYLGFSFDFTTGVTDSSANNFTLTLNGNAGISSPSVGLELDGTGDYGSMADSALLELGSDLFTLEVEGSATALTGTETLIAKGSTTSPASYAWKIDRIGNELFFFASSDGSTWDITAGVSSPDTGVSCGVITTATFRVVVERSPGYIASYLDGVTQSGVTTSATLFDGATDIEIGAFGGTQEWDGIVKSARLTVGAYLYGSPHAITNSPFSDSGNYTAGTVYSEKPALAWNDLATNPYFGLNATTTGVQEAMDYGDTTLDSGAARCRIGISISEPRLVEQWLDVLAMYANSIWFPEGANLKIVPDKIKDGTNGSGPELYAATSPEFGSPLPTITTEDSVSYSISIEITAASTTSPLTGVSVEFGGVEVIAAQVAVGVYGATVDASGTSNTIEVIEDVGFDGTWASLSVKRTHRKITQWLPKTLSVQGLAEGDKPNSVAVRYTVPDDASGAWKNKSFGVMNADAIAGDPIVLTTLDLPGVYRIEEASNKAIAKLYREDRKIRVSLISTDEEVVCQPGDTVHPFSTYRGIDNPVWVESSRMVTYGRHQIIGTIYRDNQFPDTDYTEGGTLTDGGYAEEPDAGGNICVINLPTDGDDIIGELIYDEAVDGLDEALSLTGFSELGLVGVYGNSIIVNAGGKRVVSSSDLGATWTEQGDFPASVAAPSDPGEWLFAASFNSATGGGWTANLKDTGAFNSSSYQGGFTGGSGWTFTSDSSPVEYGWWNDGYSFDCTASTASGGLLTVGRAADSNVYVAIYDSPYGSTTEPAAENQLWTEFVDSNVYDMHKVSGGYFVALYSSSSQWRPIYFNSDISASPSAVLRWDATNWGNVTYLGSASNGSDIVIIPKGNATALKWTLDASTSGALPTVSITGGPVASGDARVAWQGSYFMLASPEDNDYWMLYHSEDDGESFTYGARVKLPTTQTSSGVNFPPVWHILPAGDKWIGYYVGTDSRVKIFKFTYGTQSGSCPIGGAPP